MAKTARIEVRADADSEALLKRAADLTNQTLTSFILSAAEERAQQVVADSNTTVVPSEYFDELLDALDRPPVVNPSLRKAARRLNKVIDQR